MKDTITIRKENAKAITKEFKDFHIWYEVLNETDSHIMYEVTFFGIQEILNASFIAGMSYMRQVAFTENELTQL